MLISVLTFVFLGHSMSYSLTSDQKNVQLGWNFARSLNSTFLKTENPIHNVGDNKNLTSKIIFKPNNFRFESEEIEKMFRNDWQNSIPLHSDTHFLKRFISSPLGSRLQCTLSKSKLSGIKNEINRALENKQTPTSVSSCDLNSEDTDNCEQLVKLIQCGVDHLKSGFLQAVVSGGTSLEEVTKWKNAFEDLFKKYEKDIDNAKASVSQEHLSKIDGLITSLQTITELANNLKKELKTKTKDLCISEIGSGKVPSAIHHYQELVEFSDYDKLEEIIGPAYEKYGKIDNVRNIVQFIKGISQISKRTEGFTSLYEKMKVNGHLNSPVILIIFSEISSSDYPKDLKDKFTVWVDTINTSWGRSIRENNFGHVTEIANKNPDYFRPNIDRLVKSAYANNLENAESLLNFIRSLSFIEDSCEAISALFANMKNNNHLDSHQLMLLAYQVKKLTDNYSYSRIGYSYKNKMSSLKENLPSSVVSIFWDGTSCTIKNRVHNEYFYAASWYHDHKVYTWVEGNIEEDAYWNIEVREDGRSFALLNTHNNGFIYADHFAALNDGRRKVRTWAADDIKSISHYWRLSPVNNGEYFTIFNIHEGEYLYADGNMDYGFGSSRRGVFTWGEGNKELYGIMKDEGNWKIIC